MSPMANCSPGEWHLVITCEKCGTRQPIIHDLSKREAAIIATYTCRCSACQHSADYASEVIERYLHPPTKAAEAQSCGVLR